VKQWLFSSAYIAGLLTCQVQLTLCLADEHERSIQHRGKRLPRHSHQCLSPVFRVTSCNVFTARCTIVQSAVLRLHVVHLSVRPSVTLVDQDHIGWKSWKLTARTISATPSLFVDQRPFTFFQGTWEDLGETRGGVGKSGVLEQKSSNISETRKDRGKVTMEDL